MAVAVTSPFIQPLMCPRRRGLGLRSFDLAPLAMGSSEAGAAIEFQVVPQSGARFDPCSVAVTCAGPVTAKYGDVHKMADDLLQRFGLDTTPPRNSSARLRTPRSQEKQSSYVTEGIFLASPERETAPKELAPNSAAQEINSGSCPEPTKKADVSEAVQVNPVELAAEAVTETSSAAVVPAAAAEVDASSSTPVTVVTAEMAIQTERRRVSPAAKAASTCKKEQRKKVVASATQTAPPDVMGFLNPGVGPFEQRPRQKVMQQHGICRTCAERKGNIPTLRGRRYPLMPSARCQLCQPHGKATSVPPESRGCKETVPAGDVSGEPCGALGAGAESSGRASSTERRRRWSSGGKRSTSGSLEPTSVDVEPLVRLASNVGSRACAAEAQSPGRSEIAMESFAHEGLVESHHRASSSTGAVCHRSAKTADSLHDDLFLYPSRPAPVSSPQPSSPRQVPEPAAQPSTAPGSLDDWGACSPTGRQRSISAAGSISLDEPKSFAEVSLKWEQKAREKLPPLQSAAAAACAASSGTQGSSSEMPFTATAGASRRVSSAMALGLDQATIELEALVEDAHRALVRDGLFPPFESDVVEEGPISIPSLDAVDRALEELQRGLAEIDSALARPRA
mmetsp:Transcript_54522/g.100895  ORF Transcript_54522/g.100895 Transcript_54522/m.100895 type:complete len:623 (-) Transcript_54522:183-2051(-)